MFDVCERLISVLCRFAVHNLPDSFPCRHQSYPLMLYCRHSPSNTLISTSLRNLHKNICTNFTESEFTLKATGQNVFTFSKQIYEKDKMKMNGNRENVGTRGKVMMCCVKRHCSIHTQLYKTYLAAARR